MASLLGYYGVPLLVTTDTASFALTSEGQVAAAVQQQIDQMRTARYDHTETLSSEVTILNSKSALYRWTISRRQRDGIEISRITFTELLIDGSTGRRISAMAIHGN